MHTGDEGRAAPEIFAPMPIWQALPTGRVLQGLTVLLVEDSRLASEAMRLLCQRSGARIRRADGHASALRHMRSYRPGAVIVDLGLPDGDGVALIAQISTMVPRVPVLLGVSGDPDRREAALAAGADGFLAKPVASLAAFQQAILGALPAAARPSRPRALSGEVVVPDRAALRDDLAYLASLLRPGMDTRSRRYAAQFLDSVGCVAGEPLLIEVARELTGPAGDAAIPRLRAWLEHRLDGGRLM